MKERITEIVKNCGITDIGFCRFSAVEGKLLECRAKGRIPENAKTVILFLFPYKVREERPDKISRYAAVPDYHIICEKYLEKIKQELEKEFKDEKFEAFIDNSPIPEVYSAARAGLGVKGENGLLINEKWGSWCFIGEIVTTLDINCENSFKKCPLCGNCKKACPSGLQRDHCLSALSQQKKELSEEEKALLLQNNIIWGCDICAEICPLNKNSNITYIKEFIEGYRDSYTLGEDISGRAYEWRGEKTVSRNAKLFKK